MRHLPSSVSTSRLLRKHLRFPEQWLGTTALHNRNYKVEWSHLWMVPKGKVVQSRYYNRINNKYRNSSLFVTVLKNHWFSSSNFCCCHSNALKCEATTLKSRQIWLNKNIFNYNIFSVKSHKILKPQTFFCKNKKISTDVWV